MNEDKLHLLCRARDCAQLHVRPSLGRPTEGSTRLTPPPPGLSVLALWGLMNYFLQSGLRAINPAAVPSALRAAEHRAAGAVCVFVSDT